MSIPQIQNDSSVQFSELYYITPIENVPSILENGILSYKRAQAKNHQNIANNEVNARREHVVPDNPARRNAKKQRELNIHQYANLYMRAHNAMMYDKTKNNNPLVNTLCVLRIDPAVVQRRGVVYSNINAAVDGVRFGNPGEFRFKTDEKGFMNEKFSYNHTEDADHKKLRKNVTQAEVEVPKQIHPSYVRGVYVANDIAEKALKERFELGCPIPIDLHPSLFFVNQGGFQTVNGSRVANFLSPIQSKPLSNTEHPALNAASPPSSDDEG